VNDVPSTACATSLMVFVSETAAMAPDAGGPVDYPLQPLRRGTPRKTGLPTTALRPISFGIIFACACI